MKKIFDYLFCFCGREYHGFRPWLWFKAWLTRDKYIKQAAKNIAEEVDRRAIEEVGRMVIEGYETYKNIVRIDLDDLDIVSKVNAYAFMHGLTIDQAATKFIRDGLELAGRS